MWMLDVTLLRVLFVCCRPPSDRLILLSLEFGTSSLIRLLSACLLRRRVDPTTHAYRPTLSPSFGHRALFSHAGTRPLPSCRRPCPSSSLFALSAYPPPSVVVVASLPFVLRRPDSLCAPPSQDHSAVVGVGCVLQLRCTVVRPVCGEPRSGCCRCFLIHAKSITAEHSPHQRRGDA